MGFLDRMLSFAISKKLTVFAIATVFAAMGRLDMDSWVILAGAYTGVQGTIDAIKEYYKNK